MKRILSLFVLLSSLITYAQISSDYIDSLVKSSMDRMPQAGLSVAVIQDGKIVHLKGYGVKSVNTKAKVDENSLFMIASNTKAFTSTALAMLVEQGKLKWEDKVVDIIPEFKTYNAYVTANFTILDLLTHRSGMGLGAGDLMFIPDGSDFTIDDVIKSFQHQTEVSPFRTKYDYNNLLYMTAGEVVHRVSGMPWDQFVEQHIMTPVGMSNSVALNNNLKPNANVANPHRVEGDKLVELPHYNQKDGGIGAAGGIYSNATDMAKWVQMHLNAGALSDGSKLISEESHHMLWSAQTNTYFNATPPPPYKTHFKTYGLGFNLFDQNGYTIVQHSGGMPGMLSMVSMIPELNSAVIVLTNTAPGGYSFVSLTNQIKDELIGVKGNDWIGRIENYLHQSEAYADSVVSDVWETVNEASKNRIEVSGYVGTYKDEWFGEVEVSLKGTELWFSSKRSPKLSGKMYYYKANTFAIKWNYQDMNCDAFAIFSLDENGVAQSIEMKGISPEMDFSFDFQDLELKRVD